MLDLHAIITDEPASEVIKRLTELGATVGGLERAAVGPEAKVGPAKDDRDVFRVVGRGHRHAGQSAREVDPAVDREQRVTDPKLRAPRR